MKIWFNNRYRKVKIRHGGLLKLTRHVLAKMGENSAEVGLLLMGDKEIRRLNRRYRGMDCPTDVLAFSMREGQMSSAQWSVTGDRNKIAGHWNLAPGHCNLLGDVVISIPTARRQAIGMGHSLEREVAILMVHGLLHLLGYDHERSPAEAKVMRRKELELIKSFKGPPFWKSSDESI